MSYVLYHLAFLSIALLLTQSLNQLWRLRMFSLGHHGWAAIGAYAAISITRGIAPSQSAWHAGTAVGALAIIATLAAATAIGGFLAWLIGLLLIRLDDDYFAVGTLVVAEIIQNLLANWQYVGGAQGVELPYLVFPSGGTGSLAYSTFFALLGVGLNIALYIGIRLLDRSALGCCVRAAYDDPLSVEMCGFHVNTLRHTALVVTAAVAACAGAIMAHFTTVIVPGDFSFVTGLPIILYVVLGQRGNTRCIVAATVVYGLYELAKVRFLGLCGEALGDWIAHSQETFFALLLIGSLVVPALCRQLRCERIVRRSVTR